MKKFVFVLFLALIFALFPTVDGFSSTPETPRVMIMGDSITQGKNGDYSWRYFLDRLLKCDDISVDFVGPNTQPFTGTYLNPNFDTDHNAAWGRLYHSNTWLTGDARDYDLTADIYYSNPDVIISQLGMNDLMVGFSPQTVYNYVEEWIEEARSAKSGVDFIFGTLPGTNVAGVREYNALLPQLESLSTPHSKIVVTNIGEFTPSTDTYDNLHPTVAGELKIAAGYVEGIKESFGISTPTSPQTNIAVPSMAPQKASQTPYRVTKKPTKPVVRATKRKTKVVFYWKSKRADGYEILVKKSGKWKVVDTTGKTRYAVKRGTKTKHFKVKAVNILGKTVSATKNVARKQG